ncbi:hypothetical protein GOP47_0025466 [Adiantum capillus-veneris]|uniref:Uncharacterized protein n=1 Tax=Adiantum capillus-veneris TaxID=13818 RepID=A0A9D4U0S6_ADICA|nr:hypothetical protein GOP47_0025466 [Adiantum capillus-veneris]
MAPLVRASILLAALLMVMAVGGEGASAPKGVTLSFPPFTSAINCSIDGMADTLLTPSEVCKLRDGGKEVILSSDNVVSARYQYKKKLELWRSKDKYAASFSTAYVVRLQNMGFAGASSEYGLCRQQHRAAGQEQGPPLPQLPPPPLQPRERRVLHRLLFPPAPGREWRLLPLQLEVLHLLGSRHLSVKKITPFFLYK